MAVSRINEAGLNINQYGNRRLTYNGAMNVWQRGTSADSATNGDYMCDRWRIALAGLDGNLDWDRETSSTPDGFSNALKISMDASETSLDAGDYAIVTQRFEGQDLQQLQKGSSGAKKLSLSFWVRSSVASTYTVDLYDEDNTRSISKSYTINTADTWEFKKIVFEGDTSGALDNDANLSLHTHFWLDAGSAFTSGTFSTVWGAVSNTTRVYGTTGWLESTSPTFYITGVQLEVGDTATDFEHRSFGDELARCQRYYYQITATASTNPIFAAAWWDDTTTARGTVFLPCTMRTTPSVGYSTLANLQALDPNVVWNNFTAVALTSESSEYTAHLSVTTGGGGTNSDASSFRVIGTDNINFSAEL